jgi:peptide deformylase
MVNGMRLYQAQAEPHIGAMPILKIARMGHPVLRRRAEEVADPASDEVKRLVADMAETLEDVGGAGLAAPQVHVPKRVMIFRVPLERIAEEPGAEPVGLTELVNPVVMPLTDELELGWEGCLSLPGLRGVVPRFARVRYSGGTPEGEVIEREVSGFHARVVQHECDHLDGILYPMRMTDLSLLSFTDELRHGLPDLVEARLDTAGSIA